MVSSMHMLSLSLSPETYANPYELARSASQFIWIGITQPQRVLHSLKFYVCIKLEAYIAFYISLVLVYLIALLVPFEANYFLDNLHRL